MNRCRDCGKFRRLEDLDRWESITFSAQTGAERRASGFECKPDVGCNAWEDGDDPQITLA